MENTTSVEHSLPDNIVQPLLSASNTCTVEKSLELLIEASRSSDGRSNLASKNTVTLVLGLIHHLSNLSSPMLLVSSLKLLRNLCAGEIKNQNSFIEQKGAEIISIIVHSSGLKSDLDHAIIRMGLQVLANVSLAGEEHQRVIWTQFFPDKFVALARLRYCGTCDPLCMVIYTCCSGCPELIGKLCSDIGLPVVEEIIRTVAAAGFKEDWLKLLLSKICLEEDHFHQLFSKICLTSASKNGEEIVPTAVRFSSDQAFLLKIMSDILDERIEEIIFPSNFAMYVFGIFKSSITVLNSTSRAKSSLPTGITEIDVLGYSLTILRLICARDNSPGWSKEDLVDIIDLVLSSGLIKLLLCILRDLEPPAIIRKAIKEAENVRGLCSSKPCPYKGFRSDIVAVIGNCAYRRKRVQDDIRQNGGILLLLQQCVTDEDNPFLREWGIWCLRNLLEGNVENQRVVAELELQGSVDVPEISALGLRVEVDTETRRAKLVNVP